MGLDVFCRKFQFTAKLQLTVKLPAKILIIWNKYIVK